MADLPKAALWPMNKEEHNDLSAVTSEWERSPPPAALANGDCDLRKCEVDGVLANTYYAYFGTGNEGERHWKAARPLTIAEFRRANKTFPPAGAK